MMHSRRGGWGGVQPHACLCMLTLHRAPEASELHHLVEDEQQQQQQQQSLLHRRGVPH